MKVKLSNEQYDTLKWVALIALPAAVTLCFSISQIWGLPYGEQIMGTIAAVGTCLGALLGLSSNTYNEGTLHE